MNNKKMKKVVSVSLASALTMANFVPGFAAVDKYVLEAADSTVYEYQFSDLSAAYTNSLLGIGDTALYDHYKNILDNGGSYKAILDTVSGYVDYNNVKTAYIDAKLNGQTLDIDSYTETQAPAATMPNTVKDVTVVDGSIVETEKNVNQNGDLAVSSVSAINKTTIKVTFSEAVDAATVANFAVKVGGTAKIIDTVGLSSDKTVATLSVQGLNYQDTVAVTVTGVVAGDKTLADTTVTTNIPAIGDLYTLEVTCDDADATITADGATKTMLTAKLVENATGDVKNLEGIVTFTTNKGAVGQPDVALQNGAASVQLTSAASDETVTAYITAILSDAPGATEYEGLTGQFQVTFVPVGQDPGEVEMVQMNYAESNQADRIFVTFSGPIDKETIVNTYAGETYADKLVAAKLDNFGFDIDGVGSTTPQQIIEDVTNKSDKVLELILDVDNQFKNVGPVPTDMLEINGAPLANAKGAYLRDNITHNVSIPSNLGTKVVANSDGVDFKLTDAKKPSIFNVLVEDQLTLRVKFSEAMAEDLIEVTETVGTYEISNKVRIDGRKVMVLPSASVDAAAKLYAKDNNYIIANSLYISLDDATTEGYDTGNDPVDSREWLTVNLDKSNKLTAGTYTLQVSNVGDWAAMTDPANMVATQTFDFTVNEDNTKPVPSLSVQSPEQWVVSFDEDVTSITGKNVEDVFNIYLADGYAKSPKEGKLTYGTDFVVTPIDADGNRLAVAYGLGSAVNTDVDMFLIEMLKDWTVYYDTDANPEKTYFASAKNPYKVVVNYMEDSLANVMDEAVLDAQLGYDGLSPTIADAVDVYDLDDNKIEINGTPTTAASAGQYIAVTMSEPVQMINEAYVNDLLDNGTIDTEDATIVSSPLTPSQDQGSSEDGIPVPTFEFVKGDKVVTGSVATTSVREDDQLFVVKPDNTLEAGTWTLYIRSISDDIGNTSSTVSKTVIVPDTQAANTDTKVAWAAFDDTNKNSVGNDYIYIKFTKEMKSSGANGVAATTNYVFKGVELPEGSSVIKGIKGVTNDWDGVTIEMPANTWDGLGGAGADFGVVLNVANNFESVDNEQLSAPYEIQLDDISGSNSSDSSDDMLFEAKYINTDVSVNFASENIIIGAAGYDADEDGKIEGIVLKLDSTITDANPSAVAEFTDTKFYIDGKEVNAVATTDAAFDVNLNTIALMGAQGVGAIAGGAVDDEYVFLALGAGDEVNTTATDGITITTSNGAMIINSNKVLDAAAPVITKADATDGSDEIVLTFSEAVYGSALSGAIDATADIAYDNVSTNNAGTITAPTAADGGVITITVTTDANVDAAADIGTDTIGAAANLKDIYDNDRTTSTAGVVPATLE